MTDDWHNSIIVREYYMLNHTSVNVTLKLKVFCLSDISNDRAEALRRQISSKSSKRKFCLKVKHYTKL